MVQWNLKTRRRRRIRRGEPRPSLTALQAQMVEKDAQLKQVQSEKQSVLDENATLKSLGEKYLGEIDELKSTVARLELLGVKCCSFMSSQFCLHLIVKMLCDAEWKGLRKVLGMFILILSLFCARFDMIDVF